MAIGAAASLSSSSRQRRGGNKRGPPPIANKKPPVLERTPARQGSRRNLVRQPSLKPQNLGSSLSTLLEESRRDSDVFGSLMASAPELYLNNDEKRTDGVDRNDLLRRKKAQNTEEISKSTERRRSSKLDQKDSFVEDNSVNESSSGSVSKAKHPLIKAMDEGRKITGNIINDYRVQNIILVMIIVNAIMMGIATFPLVKGNPNLASRFELVDQVFLVLFTIESGMQLVYHGWCLIQDGFLVFDLLIVVMSWGLEGTQVIRAFRIFRALRLITRVEVMKNLVLALFSVIPKMAAIGMLLLLIFYIFAVMFTQLFKGMYDEGLLEDKYFAGLDWTLFTLFQMMTLDEWANIQYQVAETYPWAWVPFMTFIIITGFVVVNLIIAVICDAVHLLGKQSKAALYGQDDEMDATQAPHRLGDQFHIGSSAHLPTVLESCPIQGPDIFYNESRPNLTYERRLQEMQQKLDEMVAMQDQMKQMIDLLAVRLRESAPLKAPLTIPAEDSTRSLKPVS